MAISRSNIGFEISKGIKKKKKVGGRTPSGSYKHGGKIKGYSKPIQKKGKK